MATIKMVEDLEVWQLARTLADDIYASTLTGSFSKDYSLKDQINRASGSVRDNIAEGFERGGNKEFIQFLAYAKGSSGEVCSQLYHALDRKHITGDHYNTLQGKALQISKMATGLMTYLGKSTMRGTKYKTPKAVNNNEHKKPETLNLEAET